MLKLTRATIRPITRLTLPLLLLCANFARPQALSSFLSGSKAPAQTATVDPLKRETPRASIYSFLQACHSDNLLLASQYLDLRAVRAAERSTVGPELARNLCDFLDRDPHFEVAHLSSSKDGDLADGLSPELDVLDNFHADHRDVTLYLERSSEQATPIWLVSRDSVEQIPQLGELRKESPFERKLPEPLVRIEWIDTPVWIWITLVLIALLLRFISGLFSRAVLLIVRPLLKRYVPALETYRLENFSEPVRLLLSVAVFRACMTVVAPSALLRDYLLKLIILLVALGLGSLLMRVVDLISDRVILKMNPRERTVSYSVAPLLVRFFKICIFCFAVLFVLAAWGYNTTTILAGVGVGGLAVALAAQKTIENLFGGIALISDRAVLVGDFCQFGGQVGTVEDIGLRSTRIRTLDRTLVTIPNSQFSTMTLENFSKRDRMWFHPAFHLHRDTTAAQVREMMSAIERVLHSDPIVDPTDVPVRFTKITSEAYVIEVFAYVLTADFNEFLKAQSDLLLRVMEAAARIGVTFALPIQETFAASNSPVRSENVEVDA